MMRRGRFFCRRRFFLSGILPDSILMLIQFLMRRKPQHQFNQG